MRKQRRRINLSLDAEEYARLEQLAQAGGFKNVCAFARVLLSQVADYAAAQQMNAQQLARQPTPIAQEINEMFSELIDWDAATPAQKRAAIAANEKRNEL